MGSCTEFLKVLDAIIQRNWWDQTNRTNNLDLFNAVFALSLVNSHL